MQKSTYLEFDHPGLIGPGQTVRVVARTQVRIHPHRLRIEPQIALFFAIEDVRVGQTSLYPQMQRVPASQFCHGAGDAFDAGEVDHGIDLIMTVTNESHLVPDGPLRPCAQHRDPACRSPGCPVQGRLGCPLPFRATWASIVVPPRDTGGAAGRLEHDGLMPPGAEDLGTRLGRVRGAASAPPPVRREVPGFGWDPYGED